MRTPSPWPKLPLVFALLALAPPALAQMVPGPSSPVAPRGHAPRAELAAWAGYQLNSDVDLGSAMLRTDDAPSFGASLSVPARPGTKIELLWIYSSADARLDGWSVYDSSRSFTVDMHYFQIGGVQGFRRGNIEPFAGMTLGAAWYLPGSIVSQDGSYAVDADSTWRFAFTLGGGLNVFLTQKLAVRLQARMLAPVFFSSGSFYVGTGGSGLAVSGGIPFIQGDFSAGLVFAP
jgi:opacity protein-like surface antigen